MPSEDVEHLAKSLESHPDYRVTRRLVVRDVFSTASPNTVARGAVVDTETTGTDPAADQILEVAIVVFEFDPDTGEVLRVIDAYSGLEDPGRPIPPESTAIHGITDEMVAGKRIYDGRVAAALAGVSIVIAHNAQFDRPFLEHRLSAFAKMRWACSMSQIDWKSEGFGSVGLEFLAHPIRPRSETAANRFPPRAPR